jgi:hypothetical protein
VTAKEAAVTKMLLATNVLFIICIIPTFMIQVMMMMMMIMMMMMMMMMMVMVVMMMMMMMMIMIVVVVMMMMIMMMVMMILMMMMNLIIIMLLLLLLRLLMMLLLLVLLLLMMMVKQMILLLLLIDFLKFDTVNTFFSDLDVYAARTELQRPLPQPDLGFVGYRVPLRRHQFVIELLRLLRNGVKVQRHTVFLFSGLVLHMREAVTSQTWLRDDVHNGKDSGHFNDDVSARSVNGSDVTFETMSSNEDDDDENLSFASAPTG